MKTKDILKKADELQKEANSIINDKKLWQPLLDHGKIIVGGSTFLDLLVFPDLDVYFEINHNPIDVLAQAAKHFIKQKNIPKMDLQKDLHEKYLGQVPEGIFLQFRLNNGQRIWKVDIWSINDPKVVSDKMKEVQHFKDIMTPKQRELILQVKTKLAAPFGRTPVFSSYNVYKAVLEEGVNDAEAVIDNLKAKGCNVDKIK